MGKATGQMQEHTRNFLIITMNFNNWDYNEMCRFISNHSEEISNLYTKYQRL